MAKRPLRPAPAAPAGRPAAVIRLSFLDSDAQIVAAIRAGDGAGGAALYDRHHGYVRRVLGMDPMVVAVHRNHPLAHRQAVSIDVVACLLYTSPSPRDS